MEFSELPEEKRSRRKLNLGCGHFPKEGYLNVDISDLYPADLLQDLDIAPWPFPDNQYDLIEMDHVLEHLTDVRASMNELERILAPGGCVVLKVPHFSRGFTHWDHKHGFDFSFGLYFGPGLSGGFEKSRLRCLSTRLTWFAQPYLKKDYMGPLSFHAGRFMGAIFDLIGNINHNFTSRIFCYWIGGYDEIAFVLEKPAD